MNTSDHTIIIPISKGAYTAVSFEDADLALLKWYHSNGYAVSPQRKAYLHRLIMGRIIHRKLTRAEHVDHKDGNPLNNTRRNLRIATQAENVRNQARRKNSTSPYKGVRFSKGAWQARIQVGGKGIHLGRFATAELAYKAYCEAAIKYHGEFARLE